MKHKAILDQTHDEFYIRCLSLLQEVPSMLFFNSEYQEVPSTSSHKEKVKKTKSKKSSDKEKLEKPKKQKHSSSKCK